MNLLTNATKDNFEWWGWWNNDPNYYYRTVFSQQPAITVGTNGANTIITVTGNQGWSVSGPLVFVDTVTGNDAVGFYNNGTIGNLNSRGAPSGKIRFTMSQSYPDFRGPDNTTTFTAGAEYVLGDYKVYGNGEFSYLRVTDGDPINTIVQLLPGDEVTITTAELGAQTVTISGDYTTIAGTAYNGWYIVGNIAGAGGDYDATVLTFGNGTYPTPFSGTWDIRQFLDQQAFVGRLGEWWATLGKNGSQRTEAIAVDTNSGRVYAAIDMNNGPRHALVIALSINDGSLLWSKWAENKQALSAQIGSIVTNSGNVYVVTEDDDSNAILTKFNSSNGDIVWQLKHQSNGNFDNRPVAAFDESDGNIIVSGVFYEEDYENDDVVAFWKINSDTGAVMYKTMLVDRSEDRGFNEYYREDCQPFSVNNGRMAWGGYIDDDENEYEIGVAVSLPSNGSSESFGRYGRWEYKANEDGRDWIDNTANADTSTPDIELTNNIVFNVENGGVEYYSPEDMTDPSQDYQSEPYSRIVGNLPGKIIFSDDSEIAHPGIARHSVRTGDASTWLGYEMNGKFIYYNNSTNYDNETIYIPSNASTALPIGYTVTVVLGDFNNQVIFVNGGEDPDVSILVSGNNVYDNTFWKFGGVDNTPGIYTIMKIDTNTWMLAGPNVQVDD
jgi:hypothetical protein